MKRPENALRLLDMADFLDPKDNFPISAEKVLALREYIKQLEANIISTQDEDVRDIAEQLIRDGWYSGSIEELIATARRLAK